MNATERRRSLAAIIGSVFGVGVAYGALTPLISLRLAAAGVDSLVIGLQGAMFPLATLAIGAFVPRLVARVPLLPLLYASLAVATACAVLFPILPSLWAWFLLRFLMGIAGTLHWITSEIWMNALATARDRSRLMGIYATVLAAGFTVGPLAVRLTGLEGWQPFAIVAAGIVVAGIPLPFARAYTPTMPAHASVKLRGLIAREPGILFAALLAGLLDAALIVFLPLYGLRSGFDAGEAIELVAWFMAGSVALQIPIGAWADRGDRWRALRLCVLCSLLGALLLPVLTPGGVWPSRTLLCAALFLWGGTAFGLYTLSLAVLGDRSSLGELAAANTAFVMVYEIGSITGPVLVGGAIDAVGREGLVAVAVTLCSAFFLLDRRPGAPADPQPQRVR